MLAGEQGQSNGERGIARGKRRNDGHLADFEGTIEREGRDSVEQTPASDPQAQGCQPEPSSKVAPATEPRARKMVSRRNPVNCM